MLRLESLEITTLQQDKQIWVKQERTLKIFSNPDSGTKGQKGGKKEKKRVFNKSKIDLLSVY